MLLRLDAPWTTPSPDADRRVRTAPATIATFRAGGEFVELHCWLIEQPDETLYIASRNPRVVAIGTWKQRGDAIDVTRTRVARSTGAQAAATDPLCAEARLTLRISGNSVLGNVGASESGAYAPVTRLVAPDFDAYAEEARRSPVTCAKEKE